MAIAHLCKNTSFDMDGREYQLTKLISKNIWQVTEERTGRIHEFSTQVCVMGFAMLPYALLPAILNALNF